MEDSRPGGEFGHKCPHCGHYNRFSARLKWLRTAPEHRKRICSKCGKDFDKEYPEPNMVQTSLKVKRSAERPERDVEQA